MFGEENYFKTESGKDTNNPDMNHQRLIAYDRVDSDVRIDNKKLF